MDDFISRQAVLDKAYELDLIDTGNDIRVRVVDVDEVKKLPAADFNGYTERLWKEAYERGKRDAQPRRGKWIDGNAGKWNAVYCPKCSVCGTPFYGIETVRYHYCPNCGARMEGEDE